ncbi:MAG TPA: SAM-dependent methyltransferase [Acetobacteraceae bacterium]|nr:SAM-dependent methyltransferase [Acetobacteraceae bacterium]
MARANAAYYAARDPFVDFTTAPEISQAFGEILGLWAAITWELLGRPAPVLLVEAGPGRGTLMADALRAIRHAAPAFCAALSVHLIETSARLRALQQEAVPNAVWHDSLETVPDEPLLLLANEFLDALPIRQFVRRGDSWTERYVIDSGFVEMDSRSPCVRTPSPQPWSSSLPKPARGGGDVFEICEPAVDFAAVLGRRLAARPGAALFLDYGPSDSTMGDSLQAIRDAGPADPLRDAGFADLTAHVDFGAFARGATAAGAVAHGPIPQGVFLSRIGLFQRTDRLARRQPPARSMALIEAARRLAEPDRMGRLFKALALCHPGCPTPPGFES